MKAVILSNTGSFANLKYTDYHFNPKRGRVKIKVLYCGLNHLDLLIIEGKRPTNNQFPLILGSEIVGKNTQTGEVFAVYPWTFCGECVQCKAGCENICDRGGALGRTENGGYAEYVSVEAKNLVAVPKKVDPKLVCASTLSAVTALHMIKRAGIPDRATVLINGSTGGVGTSAIQILKNKKCKVIATTSHQFKVPFLKKTGADVVLVNKLPGEVPYIIDAMGGRVWSDSLNVLAKNGTIVFCATTLEGFGIVNIGQSFNRQLNILGSYGGTMEDLKEVIAMVGKGIIKPVIDSVFGLKDVKKALKKLNSQKQFGKILIKV